MIRGENVKLDECPNPDDTLIAFLIVVVFWLLFAGFVLTIGGIP